MLSKQTTQLWRCFEVSNSSDALAKVMACANQYLPQCDLHSSKSNVKGVGEAYTTAYDIKNGKSFSMKKQLTKCDTV